MKIIFVLRDFMESVYNKMHSLYGEMGKAEKRLADFILDDPQNVIGMSISDMADNCSCGVSTVVRFSRRLGFNGYQELKVRLAAELGSVSSVNHEILPEDSCLEIFNKQMEDIYLSLKNTSSILEKDKLEECAKMIMNAEKVVIFGLGNSASIALDFAHKLLRVGINAQACSDNHMQAIISSHLNRNSLAVGISHSGSSKDIVEALELAKIGGAKTVCITNYGNSPVVEKSDIALFTSANETKRSILALSSRISQLAIIDAVYSYIVVHSDKSALQAIYNTEYSLRQKKY